LQQLGFDPNQGLDKYFFDKAKLAKKEIVGLETIEYQLGFFDGMEMGTQELLLLQTLNDLETLEGEFDEIVKSWATGDIEALERTLLKDFAEYPEVYKRFVSERNRNWLPKIESLVGQRDNYLVIVGTLHLVGKEGVIELLKERGYSVEQL
jgi:uncharacterized protein YbaP (TraB family)